jgi:hypothetical protein
MKRNIAINGLAPDNSLEASSSPDRPIPRVEVNEGDAWYVSLESDRLRTANINTAPAP